MRYTRIIISLGMLSALFPAVAYAGISQVFPPRISVAGGSGEITTHTITITNTDTIPQRYVTGIDTDTPQLTEYASIAPNTFMLKPGESKDIIAQLRIPNTPLAGTITIVAYDAPFTTNAIRIGNGVKIPVQFNPGVVLGASIEPTQTPITDNRQLAIIIWLATCILALGVIYIGLRTRTIPQSSRIHNL